MREQANVPYAQAKSEQNRKYFNDNSKAATRRARVAPAAGSRQRKQQRVTDRRRVACEHAETKAPTSNTTSETPPPTPALPSPAALPGSSSSSSSSSIAVISPLCARSVIICIKIYMQRSKQNSLAINYENTLNRWVRVQMSPPEAEAEVEAGMVERGAARQPEEA